MLSGPAEADDWSLNGAKLLPTGFFAGVLLPVDFLLRRWSAKVRPEGRPPELEGRVDMLGRDGLCGDGSAMATHLVSSSSPGAGYSSQGVTSSIEPVAVRGRIEILTLLDRDGESAMGGAPTRVGRDGRRMEEGEGESVSGAAM